MILVSREEVSQAAIDELHRLLVWWSVWIANYLSKDAHQSGFQNLLLDGWWLEFWEIIVLAAGDVERNPGPRQITSKLRKYRYLYDLILLRHNRTSTL